MKRSFCLILIPLVVFSTNGFTKNDKNPQTLQTDAPHQTIRFYKINKQEQLSKLLFINAKINKRKISSKTKNNGCHNFLKRGRVFQVNQFGYQYCSLYTDKNCQEGSIVQAFRKKEGDPIVKLSQGYNWQLVSKHKKGTKIKSWYCQSAASESSPNT